MHQSKQVTYSIPRKKEIPISLSYVHDNRNTFCLDCSNLLSHTKLNIVNIDSKLSKL